MERIIAGKQVIPGVPFYSEVVPFYGVIIQFGGYVLEGAFGIGSIASGKLVKEERMVSLPLSLKALETVLFRWNVKIYSI